MPKYYVNDNAQQKGEHEVHKENCFWLALTNSTTNLGSHENCKQAILKAKQHYSDVDGCATCCPQCHAK